MRAWRRLAVPIALTCAGVWLLIGCIYLPLPEHRTDTRQKDFRDLVGDPDSKRPLRPGSVTRSQAVSALGPPPYVSADGRAIGYTLETERAVWLWPLCFTATTAKQRLYGLRLVFDEHDRLAGWKMTHVDRGVSWFMDLEHTPPQNVIGMLNGSHDGPELEGPPQPRAPAATEPATRP